MFRPPPHPQKKIELVLGHFLNGREGLIFSQVINRCGNFEARNDIFLKVVLVRIFLWILILSDPKIDRESICSSSRFDLITEILKHTLYRHKKLNKLMEIVTKLVEIW